MFSIKRNLNRKGNVIADSAIIVLIILVFTILLPFIYKFMTEFNSNIQTSEMSATAKSTISTLTDQFPKWMDNAVLAAFFLLWIGALIASFMIDSHPAFFIFTIVLWIGLLIGMGWISNAYENIMITSNMSAFTAYFPITSFIMSNLLGFMVLVGLTVGAALFAKSRQ